jgi:ABC-2 type transport system ATP-binding protein
VIEIKDLEKSYGNKKAVDKISFTVENGEILGFLGPNGAGKSTTMNMITGYISMSGGSVSIQGHDILEEPMEAKKAIGYLPEQPPLYQDMTVKEYLNFVYDLKGVKLNVSKRDHIENVMEISSVADVKNRRIKNLSKGYKQRVGLAQALIGKPEVLILDEPTVGLDPNQIVEIRNVIKNLKKDHTIILSTHILSEVSAICDRVVIINNGKIAAIDTPDNLGKLLTGKYAISLKAEGETENLAEKIREIPSVTNVTLSSDEFYIESEGDVSREVSALCASVGALVTELKKDSPSLERIFAALTTDEEEKNESDI